MAYNSANPYNVYQHANETINHADQIIMLYVSAITYVRQAKEAAREQDHETRYNLIDKTLSIIQGLRVCLDFSANEKVSSALNGYYESMELLLVAAQCEDNKEEICDKILENLRIIKECWESINVYEVDQGKTTDMGEPPTVTFS